MQLLKFCFFVMSVTLFVLNTIFVFVLKSYYFFHTNTLMHANDQIVASSPSCRHRFAAAVLLKSLLFSWMV